MQKDFHFILEGTQRLVLGQRWRGLHVMALSRSLSTVNLESQPGGKEMKRYFISCLLTFIERSAVAGGLIAMHMLGLAQSNTIHAGICTSCDVCQTCLRRQGRGGELFLFAGAFGPIDETKSEAVLLLMKCL